MIEKTYFEFADTYVNTIFVDGKCRFRSGDRKVNYTALGRKLGCSDNHAKTLLKKYAFYLIKDDEMGYTI
jgi:hypothetical protein